MLVAAPYINFDVRTSSGPPRVISEIRKRDPVSPLPPPIRPKISGDLLVICANERRWWPRRVTIRAGQLHVASAHGENAPGGLRIPLRHLSLRAGPLPNSLALCKGQNVILTLQTASEHIFDLWVKTIAIELIRQTPLDAVKYLDILTLAECWKHKEKTCEKDWNSNSIENAAPNPYENCTTNKLTQKCLKDPIAVRDRVPESDADQCELPKKFHIPRVKLQEPVKQTKIEDPPKDEVDGLSSTTDEKAVEVLLKKCQNSENYVPVKEKLMLFESLCRLGRKVRSTEDVSVKVVVHAKRARSLHDLSNCESSHIAVREICKYFENKNDENECKRLSTSDKNRRLINSDSQLNNVQTFNRNTHNISYT